MQFVNEYLVQVKGTVGNINGSDDVVTSLTFVTNEKSYGPYGNVQGHGFESSPHGRVVGFFGKSGSHLDQVGVIKECVVEGKDFVDGGFWEGESWKGCFTESATQGAHNNVDTIVVQGPWGGQGGDSFYDGRGDIVEIVITHNKSHILSFQASYDQGGVDFQADMHGGRKGAKATVRVISSISHFLTISFPFQCVVFSNNSNDLDIWSVAWCHRSNWTFQRST